MNLRAWDLDGTIGIFDKFYYILNGIKVPEDSFSMVRPGIETILEDGVNYLVTRHAPKKDVRKVLAHARIWQHFRRRFYVEDEDLSLFEKLSCKRYLPVLAHARITPKEASECMCIYGDNPFDRPGDLKDVVFMDIRPPEGLSPVEDVNQYMYHADLLLLIENVFREDGHLKKGFDIVYNSLHMAVPIGPEEERNTNCHRVEMCKGVVIDMEYWMNKAGVTPVIPRIFAPDYLLKGVPLI